MRVLDSLSTAFAALADPTRRDMLTRLKEGPLTVSELASGYAMSRPAVSQHLTVLANAGLVERDRRGQWRECRLDPGGLDEASAWLEGQRTEWTERLDLLEEHLARRDRNDANEREGERP
jgi:DNA-binding transcriptional ArsR family regulator